MPCARPCRQDFPRRCPICRAWCGSHPFPGRPSMPGASPRVQMPWPSWCVSWRSSTRSPSPVPTSATRTSSDSPRYSPPVPRGTASRPFCSTLITTSSRLGPMQTGSRSRSSRRCAVIGSMGEGRRMTRPVSWRTWPPSGLSSQPLVPTSISASPCSSRARRSSAHGRSKTSSSSIRSSLPQT